MLKQPFYNSMNQSASLFLNLMATFSKFSSTANSVISAQSPLQRNRWRRATRVPIRTKLGTKSRFWALSAISKCQFDTLGMDLPNLLILDCFSNLV